MTGNDSDQELLRRAVGGDRASLSQLLLLHYDELNRHISSRISKNLQGLIRADDILQMTFVRAAQAIETFQPKHEGAFRGWLRTIADNLVRDAERRRRRERRLPAGRGKSAATDGKSGPAVLDAVVGGHTTPDRKVSRRESIRHLLVALEGFARGST